MKWSGHVPFDIQETNKLAVAGGREPSELHKEVQARRSKPTSASGPFTLEPAALRRRSAAQKDARRPEKYAGLGLRGLLHRLDLFFYRLESGSEHGSGQLGNVLAIADSGFNPFFDQPLL